LQDTVGQLHKKACEAFDLIPDEVAVSFDVYVSLAARNYFIVIVVIIGRYAFGTIMDEQSIH
jgi:hypothetical protein